MTPVTQHITQAHFNEWVQGSGVNDAIAPCPSCGSARINLVQMPDHCHFAALRCGNCDIFLRWQPKPKNVEAWQKRQAVIAALLKSSQLTQWEHDFLQGLKAKKISPKQHEILNRIANKVGGHD